MCLFILRYYHKFCGIIELISRIQINLRKWNAFNVPLFISQLTSSSNDEWNWTMNILYSLFTQQIKVFAVIVMARSSWVSFLLFYFVVDIAALESNPLKFDTSFSFVDFMHCEAMGLSNVDEKLIFYACKSMIDYQFGF